MDEVSAARGHRPAGLLNVPELIPMSREPLVDTPLVPLGKRDDRGLPFGIDRPRPSDLPALDLPQHGDPGSAEVSVLGPCHPIPSLPSEVVDPDPDIAGHMEQTGPGGGPVQHAILEDQTADTVLSTIARISGKITVLDAAPLDKLGNSHTNTTTGNC